MAVSRMSENTLRKTAEKLGKLLEEGHNDATACHKLGLSLNDYEIVKSKMLEVQKELLAQVSSEDLYLEYIRNQRACIHDLNRVIDRTMDSSSKPSTTTVNAIRSRSEIYNKIIETGQQFGFIDKKPERKEIIQGVVVAHMDDQELKQAVLGQFKSIGEMMSKYDGSEGNILDIDPGPLHKDDVVDVEVVEQKALPEPQAAPIPVPDKGQTYDKQHKRNKVHKGRRVVKKRKDDA